MSAKTSLQAFSQASSPRIFPLVVLLFRVTFGMLFILSAVSKFSVANWSASAYLAHASGPFALWFQALAGNPAVDFLNLYGQLFIGLAIVFGCLIRPASFFGAILMVLYYFASFTTNIKNGWIDEHVIFVGIFLLFMFGGFGHVYGLDAWLKRQPFIKRLSSLASLI